MEKEFTCDTCGVPVQSKHQLALHMGMRHKPEEELTEIIQSPMYGIVADIVKNNKDLTKALQNAIAHFIEFEATPQYHTMVTTATSPSPDTTTKAEKNANNPS